MPQNTPSGKPVVTDHRYDFRGGRNTAVSSDLLNQNELVDTTNIRLDTIYGGFTKRTGSQRIHTTPFPNKVDGVFQWDTVNGKQLVVVSNGKLYYRNGFDYATGFTQVSPAVAGVAHSTNNGTDISKAWSGGSSGKNSLSATAVGVSSSQTVAAGSRLVCKLGDPNQTVDSAIPSADNTYTLSGFQVTLDTSGASGSHGYFSASVTWEYSTDNGGTWTPAPVGSSSVSTAALGIAPITTVFGSLTFTVPGAPTHVWIRGVLNLGTFGSFSGTITGSFQVFNTAWQVDNYTFSWTTGAGSAQLGSPVTFAPFRAASPGAPLVLFIASNNHYWSWDGNSVLTLLDPTNSTPAAYTIAAYHTRMFASTSSQPKNLFWSKIGDATVFTTGDKTFGGSALTDFLTGNALIAMEVIGSSLLLATTEAIMRFTGHASDDIVIAQDTEGISTEVGVIGPLAIKRYENTCAFMSNRGPYAATETYVLPLGEQLNPDWYALDNINLPNTCVEYNRSRKELWFAVPMSADGGQNKSIYVQSVRLNAWQGPWKYPFGITCLAKYSDSSGNPNILSGSSDGYIRVMDVASGNKTALDDMNADGTGGIPITMIGELPVIHFGIPALKKALKWILLQADLPIGASPKFSIGFDGADPSLNTVSVQAGDNNEEDYRVDCAGDSSQGFRPRIIFSDSSIYSPTIYGISIIAWNYERTT